MKKFNTSFLGAMVLSVVAAMGPVACGGDDDDSVGDGDAGDGDGDAGDGDGDAGDGDGDAGDGDAGDGDAGDGDGDMGGGTGDGDGDMTVECDILGEGLDREEIPTDAGTMTLTSDKVWTLEERVLIGDGEVLTIEPCTRIEGNGPDGVLVIGRGGKIMAEGTADEPILFTSWAEAAGEDPQPGDWGGVIILGKAPANTGDNVQIEGLAPGAEWQYGGNEPDDDSGVLQYVRIEYPGVEIGADNEINGLTMGGVGSGTTIDHVFVSSTLDDCFEWFGGRVDASYLVADSCGDDMFDADEGYQGSLTTLFGRQGSADSDDPNGWETDSKDDQTPITTITADKVTLCGLGEDDAPAATTYGGVHREGLMGTFSNQAITGFHAAFSIRDELTDIEISDSLVWGNFDSNLGTTHESSTVDPQEWFDDGDNNEEPDPGPYDVSDCQAAGGPNSEVTGSGIGAFTEEDDWLEGEWVKFAN